jgi:hypothetical protein
MNTREYTFQSLFGSSFEFEGKAITLTQIEIPIIQRDYAQGRTNEEVNRIRERFLEALFQSVVCNRRITLDFVYGDVSKDGVLTPLDGQQRLTTLFLLHWYIAKKERIAPSEYVFLNSFSYATRFSSRDFCQELVKYCPDFTVEELSVDINDQAWYPYEWKNDPTIQSMLVMIDAIHQKFGNQSDLWESLLTQRNISFYFLPLSEMGLTDDLYIKMNSRGKPLTPFEHFKAEFEEIIKHTSEELSKEINHKFDIDWTDMLFPYRGYNNIIDDEFMRYFHFISDIISYKSGLPVEKDEFKVAQQLYSTENKSAKDNIQYLRSSFDCWLDLNIPNFFATIFAKYSYESGKVAIYQIDLNIFKECLDNYGEYAGRNRKFPLNKILLIYSVIIYLQNKKNISEAQFQRRVRIIRNLIWNSSDEIRDDRMKTLLSESQSIILTGVIPETESGDLGYNVRQKEEERKKIKWLIDHAEEEDELYHLEDHLLLKGCVSVVDLNNPVNFKRFILLFDNCHKEYINRALLTFGDYSQFISWRFQIGARSNDSVWNDLFHPTKLRSGFEETFNILNNLLLTLDESNVNDDYLKKCIDSYLESNLTLKNWRYYFVKYNSMLQGNFGMYYWSNRQSKDYNIIMMNTEKSLGGKNWNVFLYTLSKLPDFSEKLSLGEYAYQGDKLKILNTDLEIECLNDKYVVSNNGIRTEYPIQQNDGVDVEDRIEKGKQIICDLLKSLNLS